jgi:hypothetical protein
MTNLNEDDKRKLSGCGVVVVSVLGLVVLATIAAVLYVLVQFGSFLGGL